MFSRDSLPPLPDDLLPYDRKNIMEVLNCLSWQVGVNYRNKNLRGFEDIDFSFMAFLIANGISEKDIHTSFNLVFWGEYDQGRTGQIYQRAMERIKGGESVRGAGSFIQVIKESPELKLIERFARELQTITNKGNGEDSPLAECIRIIEEFLKSSDPKDALIEAMKSPEIHNAFIIIAMDDVCFYEVTLDNLRKNGASRQTIDSFRKVIKDGIKKRKSAVLKDASNGKPVGEMLKDCDCPFPTLIIPSQYSLSPTGTFILENFNNVSFPQIVAHAPILITGRLKNDEDGLEYFRLAWRRDDRWKDKIVDRGIALDGKKLIQLASNGFPVAGDNAARIATYLHYLEAINLASLPYVRISNHMGWQGKKGKDGFLWGRNLISPSGTITAAFNVDSLSPEDSLEDRIAFKGITPGDEQIADGYSSLGTFEGWQKLIDPLINHPRALLGLYAAFVPPLLTILQAPNFIIDFTNRTSTGKTTVLRIAASIWGLPEEKGDGSMASWDATKVWLERASAILNGIPLILDDTKRSKKPQMVADMIYSVASGRGRGRGDTKSLARTRTWQTVLISSGEAPATSFTQEGGTRTRCLEVRGSPFGKDDAETRQLVDRINNRLVLNYGHAGAMFVSWLIKNQDRWEDFRTEYRGLVEECADIADTTEGGRLAHCFAVLTMAERLTSKAGITPWRYRNRIGNLWAKIAAEATDAAGEIRALQDIISWATSNEQRFWGRHLTDKDDNPKLPSGGWAGKWDERNWDEIGFIPTVLKSELERMGYSPDAILAGWREHGWLEISTGERGFTTQKCINGNKTRMIVIKREAIDAYGV